MNPSIPASEEVPSLISELKSVLVDALDGPGAGVGMRDIQLFDMWRQVSLHRLVDLAEAAEQFFLEERLVPGCTLTRSVVETVAIQFLVWKRLSSNIESGNRAEAHTTLMQAVFGRKDKGENWPNQSVNVLTALGHLDKKYPGFKDEYARHSEYAHPGIAGGFGFYVRLERPSYKAHFGNNPSNLEVDPWGRIELVRALLVAKEYNNLLNALRPQFVTLVSEVGDSGTTS